VGRYQPVRINTVERQYPGGEIQKRYGQVGFDRRTNRIRCYRFRLADAPKGIPGQDAGPTTTSISRL
jgi:hypothetical protein